MPSAGHLALTLTLATLAFSAGCALLDGSASRELPQVPQYEAPEAALVLDYVAVLERLARADPAEQADIALQAREAAESDPTAAHQLRHALILALPGHASSDPATASSALGELLARPEQLRAAELALAYVMYRDLDARLALLAENRQLVAEGSRAESERLQVANRRIQAQAAENARLRQELDEARAKLEAVANLERSLAERQAAPRSPPP
jgi:hypothetical protein